MDSKMWSKFLISPSFKVLFSHGKTSFRSNNFTNETTGRKPRGSEGHFFHSKRFAFMKFNTKGICPNSGAHNVSGQTPDKATLISKVRELCAAFVHTNVHKALFITAILLTSAFAVSSVVLGSGLWKNSWIFVFYPWRLFFLILTTVFTSSNSSNWAFGLIIQSGQILNAKCS